jgi:hypothetical protein
LPCTLEEIVMRHEARPRGPAWILLAFLAVLLIVTALDASAAPAETDWHLYTSEAVVDTLDGAVSDVFKAGAFVLVEDHWEIEKQDAEQGFLVTGWKPVKHALARFAVGQSRVRVAVGLRSLGPARTEVTVKGGIASREVLAGPIENLARKAGTHECEGYVEELKERLADERLSDGAGSGTPRGNAEKR